MIDDFSWLKSIGDSIIDFVKSYQPLASGLIGAFAGILGTLIGNNLTLNRERKQWAKEKIYNTYTSVIHLYSELIALTSLKDADSNKQSEITFCNLTGYLSNLLIISPKKYKEEIECLINKTSNLKQGGMIQRDKIDDLKQLRDKVIYIMKSDHRLKDLFKI